MNRFGLTLLALLFLCASRVPASAQENLFALADARAGEKYEQSVPQTLDEEYGRRVALSSRKARARWLSAGKLPAGLKLAEDGTLTGTPSAHKATPYRIRVRVEDTLTPDAEALMLTLTLKVLPPKVRLVSTGSGDAPPQPSPRRPRRGAVSLQSSDSSSDEDEDDQTATPGENEDEDATEEDDEEEQAKPKPKPTPKPAAPCGKSGITIESASAVKSAPIPVTISVAGSKIKSLEVTVRGPEKFRHRLDPEEVKKTPFMPDIPLASGKNVIYVEGLDADNKFVGCAEKVVSYNAPAGGGSGAKVTLGRNFTLDTESTFPLSVKLTDQKGEVDQLQVSVRDATTAPPLTFTRPVSPGADMQKVEINLKPGKNTVTVVGINRDGAAVTNADKTVIDCVGGCAGPDIITVNPSSFRVFDQPDTRLAVEIDNARGLGSEGKKDLVEQIYYRVTNKDGVVIDDGMVRVERDKADETTTEQSIVVRLAPSRRNEATDNTIHVSGYDDSSEPRLLTNVATTQVTCVGCTGPSSVMTGNSLHTRAIIGFEQVGGSAATSTQKPFMDFFFSAPIGRKVDLLTPGFQFWGNARIASVTQQTNPGALGTFATSGFITNFANTDVNRLVQGFDFLAGVDIKLIPRNQEGYFSLIPGTRQRTSLSFIASFGGITPLSVDESTQIPKLFTIPTVALPDGTRVVDPNFLAIFPEAAGKRNIAFVAPTRDRFFRQYYGGIRVKTLFFDKRDQPINRFPAIFDFTFGQNELVTGALRNVIRFEGFYPFPIRAANFFYLYGTATMKLGRRGGRTELPLFLDETPAGAGNTITSPDTVLVSIDKHPTLRSTRDNYRLGIGINLMELLNRLGEQPRAQ